MHPPYVAGVVVTIAGAIVVYQGVDKATKKWISNNNRASYGLVPKQRLLRICLIICFPLHIESKEEPRSLECELNLHGHQYESLDGISFEVWPMDELSFTSNYFVLP